MSRAATAAPMGRGAPAVRDRLDLFAIVVMTVLCAIWGAQQVVIKVADQQGLPPALQAGMRSAISATVLFCWVAARGGGPAIRALCRVDRSLVPGLATALIFSVEFLLLFFGLRHTTASHGVLFLYTSPFFVAVGVHLLVPAERMGFKQVSGLVCAFVGIAAAVFDGLRSGAGGLLGDAMVSGTAVLWASLTVLAKASPGLRSVTPEKVLFYQVAGSAPIMLLVAGMTGEVPAVWHAGAAAYALLLFQGIVVSFASYLIWYWLITRYPAGRLAAFTFLTPLFGLGFASWLLGEAISLVLLLALVLVAIGLHLVNQKSADRC